MHGHKSAWAGSRCEASHHITISNTISTVVSAVAQMPQWRTTVQDRSEPPSDANTVAAAAGAATAVASSRCPAM
jgi:hypothetical protein